MEEVEAGVADDFSEIGASGRRYDRGQILEVLRERLADPPEDHLRASDFTVRELAADLFLVTYALDEGARRTLRSTLWRRTPHGWSVEFHQGTVVGPDRWGSRSPRSAAGSRA